MPRLQTRFNRRIVLASRPLIASGYPFRRRNARRTSWLLEDVRIETRRDVFRRGSDLETRRRRAAISQNVLLCRCPDDWISSNGAMMIIVARLTGRWLEVVESDGEYFARTTRCTFFKNELSASLKDLRCSLVRLIFYYRYDQIFFFKENDGGIIDQGRQQRGDRELDRWSGSTIHASCGQHEIGRCDDGSFGLSVDRSWTSGFHEDTLHRAQSWCAYLRLYRVYFKADVRS